MWDVLAHARPRCHIGMRSQGGGSEPQQQQQQHHVGPSSRVCLFNELPAAKFGLAQDPHKPHRTAEKTGELSAPCFVCLLPRGVEVERNFGSAVMPTCAT